MSAITTEFRKEVQRTRGLLEKTLQLTPLQHNLYLSEKHGAEIWLKREDLSPVRSYKIRGAYSFFHDALTHDNTNDKFVCASAGNHAQGFAHACRNFGKQGWIFMPVTTPSQKVAKTKAFGETFVEIRLVGDSFDEANAEAQKFCEEQGAQFVPPFDHERIIIGQATVGAEIEEQMGPDKPIDAIILPVGGGGLAAGITSYFQGEIEREGFYFVEPDGAPSLQRALITGKCATLSSIDNFVDGAAVATIGKLNRERLEGFSPNQVVLAPTNGLCETMIDMLNVEGVVLEPAGALSIDALKRIAPDKLVGKRIVCVVSGGNFDFERLPEVKERALKFSGLKKYFILQMPQRPGALKDFLLMLGPEDDIARFEYLKKSARNFGSILIGIETARAENFPILYEKFKEAGLGYQDITDNEIVASLVI